VEAEKAQRQIEIEEMHKVKREFKPAKPERLKELEEEIKEEDIILDKAMLLIENAEKLVKKYEVGIKTEVLLYESPYDKAIENYKEAKKLFQDIGWNEEASRLINTINFYEDKKEKDEKLRAIEKRKLQQPETELMAAKIDAEKDLLVREKRVLEFERKRKEKDNIAEEIFDKIHKAEKMAKDYELNIKDNILEYDAPYEEILRIYRDSRNSFEEIGWIEESMKLISTIQFYKEKFEKDKKLRALENLKEQKREEEILQQQELLKQAKVDQERLLKRREESLLLKQEKVRTFESAKDKAFRLMDLAKTELKQNRFEEAINFYKESEEIFSKIDWQEGINMVSDSITMIKRRQKSIELEQKMIEEKAAEKLRIEEKLEEKFLEASELRKLQQEEKRKEFLRIQSGKQQEREISEKAYKLLEQGTSLLDNKKFEEANEKYVEARKLFDQISWKREVSRINNDLLYKLKREKKTFEVLEDIKKKKVEEEKEREILKKEAEKQRLEFEKQKKEEKRKQAREDFDKKILKKIDEGVKSIESFKYNEGILLLTGEREKLIKLENAEEVKRIDEIIINVKNQTQVPLITLETLSDVENPNKFESAYRALDKAQISLSNKHFMKAVSEFNEAKFNLDTLKIGHKYIKEIDDKIRNIQEKLGRIPDKEDFEAREKEHQSETERIKARITARREERRKKVLDLLKKSRE
jgi:hypothetical protein